MKLKQFIKDFDFEKPDWMELPEGFPFCNTSRLNTEESGLYSGIVFAWIIHRADNFKEGITQNRLVSKPLFNLYLTGKILFFLLFFILITGNLINYILIEVYRSIL